MIHSRVFSFSSSNRLMACPASRRMSEGLESTTNPQAELGTAAHECGEHCLRFGFEPEECLGLEFNGHTVDHNMIDAVSVYVGYVRSLQVQTGCKAMLEQRVTMSSLGRTDVFGTSDCTLVDRARRTLYVTDYKHGFGIVEVENNTQLIAYAIATLDTFQLWQDIDHVVTTIVQPRKGHTDGPIRSCSYTVTSLRETWWPQYLQAVQAGEDLNTKPVAGKHCKYCPARGFCRARVMMTLEHAYHDKPIDVMTDDEIAVLYEETENIKTNVEAIKGRALEIARNGYQFEQFKLVDGYTRAKCTDEKGLVQAAKQQGIDETQLYEQKLKSMTAVKKVLPWKLVNQFYEKPPASTTLVPMNDNRPAKRLPGKSHNIQFGKVSQ